MYVAEAPHLAVLRLLLSITRLSSVLRLLAVLGLRRVLKNDNHRQGRESAKHSGNKLGSKRHTRGVSAHLRLLSVLRLRRVLRLRSVLRRLLAVLLLKGRGHATKSHNESARTVRNPKPSHAALV